MNPTKHRRKMLEIFFEKFQVPAVYVSQSTKDTLLLTAVKEWI